MQVSRGIVNGLTWNEVAEQLANRMTSPFTKAKNNSMRIVRTEGHRINMTSQMNACREAKKKGADVVKQWDSTLDGRTRSSHAVVDGEIRELDETFSNGLMMPGDPNAPAAEVCNCRCALLQRARWALGEAELQTLQDRAEFFGLDKTNNFEEFKLKYLNASEYLNSVTNGDMINNNSYITKITPESIKSLHTIKINGLNDKQLKMAYFQRIRLLKCLIKEDENIEGSLIFSLDGKYTSKIIVGTNGKTKVENSVSKYYGIHNHPDNCVLSPQDIRTFLQRDYMYGIEAVGNNGKTVSSIVKTVNSDKMGYMQVIDDLFDEFQKNVKTYQKADIQQLNEICKYLLNLGVDYGYKVTIE